MSPPREWYQDGLRFECTLCGGCCTGPPGYVKFTDEEARAIARRLRISLEDFYREYAMKLSLGWSLRERETDHGMDCVFLDRETVPGKAICAIHEDRPTQCRTWPWWPENLKSRSSWRAAARSCEGIGQGPLVPIEAIRIQRNATPS